MTSLASPLFAAILGRSVILALSVLGSVLLLSGGLFAVTRTRWGKDKPLAKYVVLSVYAHLLFFFYAYGTKLVVSSPSHGHGDSLLRLNIVSSDDAELSDVAVPSDEPWDKPPETVEVIPDLLRPPEKVESREANAEKVAEALAAIAQTAAASQPTRIEPPAPEPPPLLPKPMPPEPAPAVKDSTDMVASSEPQKTPTPEPDKQDDTKSSPAKTENGKLADPAVAANSEPAKVGDAEPVTQRADGKAMPAVYRRRSANQRLQWAIQFGGSPQTEDAVNHALKWLAQNQSNDGRWDADLHGAGRETKFMGHDRGGAGANADTGITGLALLALLGAGNTHLEGEYREAVQHGLEFLLRSQRSDGCLAGQAELFASMYCHGMATLALGESLAMTGDTRIQPYLERAIRYTLMAQHPTTGGWRYQPGDSGDLSQFGWQLMAIKSAEQAGISVPAATRPRLLSFLQSVSSGTQKGLAAYRPGERATRTMTAEALACRFFLSEANSASTKEATDFILQEPPSARNENLYYWYYATLALFQSQDERWPQWNLALQDHLLKRQRLDDKYSGSWDPDKTWGNYGGRVYSTAMAALCLEVYYRYLPLYSPMAAAPGFREGIRR